jgi:pimeloyl-ACP methyl ester carboxylesterase
MPDFTANGHRLFFREQGHGDLLVLLPGNTASSAHLSGELAYFGQSFHAVALDFWGTGRSDRLPLWPDDWWQQGAADAAALIARRNIAPAVIIGMSGGAAVALHLALDYPHLVRAVIADSFTPTIPPGRLAREVNTRLPASPDAAHFWEVGHGADWQAVVACDSDLCRRFDHRGGDFFGNRLKQVRCPVLFTASLADELLVDVAAQNLAMVAEVPDSRVFFAKEGAHPLMWSNPTAFRAAANAFLQCLQA